MVFTCVKQSQIYEEVACTKAEQMHAHTGKAVEHHATARTVNIFLQIVGNACAVAFVAVKSKFSFSYASHRQATLR